MDAYTQTRGSEKHIDTFKEIKTEVVTERGLPRWCGGKEPAANAGGVREEGSSPGRNIPWRRKWQPTPVFLPGKFQGQRSLEGCSPWGRTESDNAEHAGMERETERSGLKAETDRE